MPTKRPTRRIIPSNDEPIPRMEEEDIEDDDEGEDSSPRKVDRSTPIKPSDTLRRGWSAGDETMASTSSFAQTLKPEEKAQLIKFLEDEPYVNYRRHWIERSTQKGSRTTRSYSCLKSFGRECPLCEAGDRAQAVSAFNVALVGDDGHAVIKSWDVGPKIFNILKGYAKDPKVAPITRGFFLVSKTGKAGSTNHQINPVKASSLEEDYDIIPPSAAELDKLEKYTADVVEVPSRKTLEEIAAEFADEYSS